MGPRCEVCRPDRTVVDGSVVLGDVVGVIVGSRAPEVAELLLCGAAAQPVEFHIHRLEPLAGDIVGHDSKHSGVIRLHRCRWLSVVHLV